MGKPPIVRYIYISYWFVNFLLLLTAFLACGGDKKDNSAESAENDTSTPSSAETVVDSSVSDGAVLSVGEESPANLISSDAAAGEVVDLSEPAEVSEDSATVIEWNTLRIEQEDAETVPQDSSYPVLELLQKNAQAGYHNRYHIPFDTLTGELEDRKSKDQNVLNIYILVDNFFKDLKQGQLDTTLYQYVLEDELSIITRQVAYSQDYAPYIIEYRLGTILSGDKDRKYAPLRVLARLPDFESRVGLILYFVYVEERWLISAIEGDLRELLIPYTTITEFVPSGTLGLTQGF